MWILVQSREVNGDGEGVIDDYAALGAVGVGTDRERNSGADGRESKKRRWW